MTLVSDIRGIVHRMADHQAKPLRLTVLINQILFKPICIQWQALYMYQT